MSEERRPLLSTPVALLAGSCVIALAVYLGLRARAPVPPVPPGPLPAQSRDAVLQGQDPVPGAPPVSVPIVVDQARAEADARAALAERKAAWMSRCWQPAVAERAEPARAVYDLDITFDSQGAQLTLGLQESRVFSRPDVAQCLRDQPLDLRIPPPGAPVRVSVHLEMP